MLLSFDIKSRGPLKKLYNIIDGFHLVSKRIMQQFQLLHAIYYHMIKCFFKLDNNLILGHLVLSRRFYFFYI